MNNKCHLILKRALLGCGLVLLAHSARAQFSLPLYERFAYTNNEALGAAGALASGANWTWGNSVSSSSAHILTSAALSYPGLPVDTTPVPNGTLPGGLATSATGTGKVRGANFSNPVTNVTIYASFMLNVRALVPGNALDRLMFGLGSATSGSGAQGAAGVWLDPSGRLKVSKNSTTAAAPGTTYPLSLSNTCFVVFRYKVNSGSPDQVDLWLNPTVLANNANIPAPDLTTTNNANAATFNSMAYNLNAPTNQFYMDEIRVGTNWSDVTPTNSAAASAVYSVSGSQTICPNSSFAINLSGTDLSATYVLYSNGVPSGTTLAGTGSAINFSSLTAPAVYTVLATNGSGTNWMAGSAVVDAVATPVISVQPAPQIAATNNTAVFTVVAPGFGLSYHWYRNGAVLTDGGHIAGSASSTLVISPATSADVFSGAQGYYCVITNSCGSQVTSTTNSLVLDAPSTIVWQGGNPTNTWDLATSANFTNAAGTAVVFNGGDNVLLDDSSTQTTLNVAGSYVAPTLLTDKANQNYAIAANSGAITGSGSVVLSGSGSLTVSNANTFTGGTTVSNGMLTIQNYNALGSGNVNLAGGTLNIPISGSATVGLSNNLNVAASSALNYARSGTSFSAVLFGILTGTPGATLTIAQTDTNTANTARLRLYSGFTNSLNLSLTTAGATNEIAPYGGTQVYNGVLSGNGHFITRGATVILNSANTLSDGSFSVIMSGGTLGLGVDSTAIGSVVQSSPVGTNDLVVTTADGNTLRAEGGARTLVNGIHYLSPVSTNAYAQFNLSGSNKLTLSGNYQLAISSPGIGTNCLLNVANTAATVISGAVTDGGAASGLLKSGSGSLYLNGANTYTGYTTNAAGLLAGTGSIAGPVVVNSGATIGGGGDLSIGSLTVNNNLALNGNVFIRVNKALSPAQSNDVISVTGSLSNTGAGTVTVTNIGETAIAVGDKFKIFSGPVSGGSALAVTGGGMIWTNRLATDGTIQALSASVANYPTNISFIVNGNGTLNISWPATHLGWYLQSQTNQLTKGLSSNWATIPGTSIVTSTNLPISAANPSVFYRLSSTP